MQQRTQASTVGTQITGMVSGSIVAFNIDFNRWHYEHQNRYWAETDPRGRRRVWRVKRNTYQPVTELCCRRSTEHGRDPVSWRTSAWWLIKNKVRFHVFTRPLRRTCCYSSVAEQSGHIFCWFSCLTWAPADAFPQVSQSGLLFWARRDWDQLQLTQLHSSVNET